MACNRETSADGAPRAPTTPATPGSCPNPDAVASSCDNNCRLSGCAATTSLCPTCCRELLLKDESAFKVVKQKDIDLPSEPAVAMAGQSMVSIHDIAAPGNSPIGQDDKLDLAGMVGTPTMADISDLRAVMKSKNSPTRPKIVVGTSTQSSGSCSSFQEKITIPSPLLPSPPPQQWKSLSSAPPHMERSVNRCVACRKRMGLLGFKCRCGDLFCASHRYSDKHDCSFDYKAAGRLAIAKENPVVIASKINKI